MIYEILKNNFSKASSTYHQHSLVQKDMAQDLLDLFLALHSCNFKAKTTLEALALRQVTTNNAIQNATETKKPCKNELPVFDNVLELGAGTGHLTALILEGGIAKKLCVNDISEAMLLTCKEHLQDKNLLTDKIDFVAGNCLEWKFNGKYDLIISNALFQWFDDLKASLQKLMPYLKDGSYLVFSSFLQENFKEIKSLLGLGLNYYSKEAIENTLKSLGFEVFVESVIYKSYGKNSYAILRDLKRTGVKALHKKSISYKELKAFMTEYDATFKDDNGVYLTWNPCYVIARYKKMI